MDHPAEVFKVEWPHPRSRKGRSRGLRPPVRSGAAGAMTAPTIAQMTISRPSAASSIRSCGAMAAANSLARASMTSRNSSS